MLTLVKVAASKEAGIGGDLYAKRVFTQLYRSETFFLLRLSDFVAARITSRALTQEVYHTFHCTASVWESCDSLTVHRGDDVALLVNTRRALGVKEHCGLPLGGSSNLQVCKIGVNLYKRGSDRARTL